ncbi:hypothetical protein MESS4_330198 [Mesorhizobium sp. STM 4661]|nr:hypothetical protein MESS4_330198 [Mesorhizobium sp. STM 4661]
MVGGAGARGCTVRFSTTCVHQDSHRTTMPTIVPVSCSHNAECPRQQIWDQSTANIPQYVLRMDAKDEIYTEGVDESSFLEQHHEEGSDHGLQTYGSPAVCSFGQFLGEMSVNRRQYGFGVTASDRPGPGCRGRQGGLQKVHRLPQC